MKHFLPLALLLAGCEQAAVPARTPAAQVATANRYAQETSTDSYMRGYSKMDQCLWGNGTCAVGASADMTARSEGPSLRTPRVRLTLRQQRLDVQFLTPFDPSVRAVTIRPTEEFFIDQPETDALGASAIKILHGAYAIDRNMGQYGGLHFRVQVY
ncbi:hypothetical protein [Hymenobacter sp. UYP22]|uniref:hypothetical protein n=1 Tax=Hymenobacter sp. UYP22 TaxID=3156348 RepID=UPI00339A8C47